MYHACARHGARHTGKRNVAMETTMATLNQYTRRGVGSFVRSFVRSAGRSVAQAKSPRGPIGHVRERSPLFPLPQKYFSSTPLPPSLPLPPSSASNPDLATIPLFPPGRDWCFHSMTLPSADVFAVWGGGDRCEESRREGRYALSRHVRIARGKREEGKGPRRSGFISDPRPIRHA